MTWGNFFTPRDDRGRTSRALWFVAMTWLFMTLRFAAGGLTLAYFAIPATSLLDYGAAVAAILAVWVAREHVKKGQ